MPIFLNALKQNGLLDRIHLSICNVGSRKVSAQDDYARQAWRVFAPNLTIYGFDADPEACEAANLEFEAREADWSEFHIPIALAKESGTATLYVTKNPMCSSLYRPNEELLQHFSGLPALVNLDHTTEVETTTLDTFCQAESIDEIDFLQIDVQGAELQVLEGAVQILNQSVLVVQAEVEFSPLYENQPLFADVDAFLRRQGFTLFDVSKAQIARSPIRSINRPGQLLWGDAIYLRDPFAENTPEQFKTPDQIFKLACIADALQFTDFALELLKTLTLKHGKDSKFDFENTILTVLNQMPELGQSPGAMALIAELETWRAIQS
ncbi:FkbM family methyltransferase [Leptolyngbya sp. FACHB-17]|uniref:FkbM family methyltransferase n=1 Tax=unclassified Leptolyngbya TaxID=2650499 RepID=UPI001681AC96|nr:FkbM family methyltransferase [Leptolyngbya sp. FACHB-17]MBD2082441.1 FkbM family methyltransferase [Leptolyngbya sp. FACHB-17]